MKPNPLALLSASILMTVVPAAAQMDATSWTNIEGTTIWARLDGIAGDKVILNMRGRTYRVPMCRLAPRSVEKARRMLNLEKTPARAAETRMASVREIVIPDIGPPDDCVPPPVPDKPVRRKSGVVRESSLPVWGERPDVQDERYASVLPPGTSAENEETPNVIRAVVAAANQLQDKPYKWGGGHGRIHDSGYDCSGSVSYVLIRAGLLKRPLTSGSFTRFGAAGPGRWITIYAKDGHVFMTICGLRFDTGGHGGRGESGPRWRHNPRNTTGFVMRHPPGC